MEKIEILYGVECLKKYVEEKEWEEFQKCFTEIIEKIQSDAFMKGYEYAITILKDSIVKK